MKTNLLDHFPKYLCQRIEQKLQVTTVEDLQALPDEKILSVTMFGKMALQKLRNLDLDNSIKTAKCMDCRMPYEDFGMDLVMPRAQWLQINPKDGGLLCANCMVKRASKVPGATCVHAIIEIFKS